MSEIETDGPAEASHSPGAGHLYVLELSTDAVKVGMSTNPRRRLSTHTTNASVYGVEVLQSWTSPRVDDIREAERELLAALNLLYDPFPGSGKETFRGVTYDQAVFLAQVATGASFRAAASATGADVEAEDAAPRSTLSTEEARARGFELLRTNPAVSAEELAAHCERSVRWANYLRQEARMANGASAPIEC